MDSTPGLDSKSRKEDISKETRITANSQGLRTEARRPEYSILTPSQLWNNAVKRQSKAPIQGKGKGIAGNHGNRANDRRAKDTITILKRPLKGDLPKIEDNYWTPDVQKISQGRDFSTPGSILAWMDDVEAALRSKVIDPDSFDRSIGFPAPNGRETSQKVAIRAISRNS